MCLPKRECSDFDKGFIAGAKGRAALIAYMVKACEDLGYDVEALTDLCIYPSGVEASADAEGDNPDDFVRYMTSMNWDVFDKEIVKLDPDHSVARFHYCPLCDMWLQMGLPPERISLLCNLANKSDFGRVSNFKNTELSFPKRLGAGDPYCELVAKKKKA